MSQRAFVLLLAFAGAPPLAAQVTIDFDEMTATCSFSSSLNLTEHYAALGVHFSGPGPLDGGAVLNECSNFGLPAHSGVNFLAFYDDAVLMNHGKAADPGTIRLDQEVASATIWVGSGWPAVHTLDAFKGNDHVDTHTILTQDWGRLSVAAPGGIDRLVVSSESIAFVLDDLSFPIAPTPYCTAKANSIGCPATIGSAGVPSASAATGFTIVASEVLNQKLGILLYSVTGRAAIPFQGGLLCVAPPVQRTPPRSSGGHLQGVTDCSGGYRIDMNEFASGTGGGQPDPQLRLPGTFVHCQWWSRDPGYAPPNASALTSALQYVIGP